MNLYYNTVRNIFIDVDPFAHFGYIKEMIFIIDGEILRLVSSLNRPLDKYIFHELSCVRYYKIISIVDLIKLKK